MPIKRVTGIGGIFFKAEDTDLLNAWYRKHLGITSTIFQWRDAQASGRTG
ncbi:VOC family protein, partial [candidate division KSB1 bacterium]|nr:VOC family protein [candidate division KSB1 bacterium]NIT75035.1 VOC family protein [candidate division KSB1 bacterium]NIU28819.1 VOC family protein [candidate division KSB1 bacterium]NIU92540.1 VOC family protein [candidate division KSB1 bacterium]NIV96524.1 VOC family protein [candidate division KSB1 bacterium]